MNASGTPTAAHLRLGHPSGRAERPSALSLIGLDPGGRPSYGTTS